ncbi:MAG: phosphate ABC transporter substrate-binding protein [Myxococcota bacterium]
MMLILSLVACGPAQKSEGDAATPGGNVMIQNKGSDTIVNVAQALAEEYRKVKPNVAIAVSGGGSGTGIAALENGTVDLANSSREIKAEEKEKIKAAQGKEPIEHTIAYDGLAIYVHKDNPIAKITKQQLADVYGEGGKAEKWTDLGVEVPGCADQQIVRVSRQNNSGTYEYFREWTLGKGDFKLGSRDMQGSKDVVDLVTNTPCAIGYSGLGYTTPEVRMACVAMDDAAQCVEPSVAAVLDKSYPISRGLYMYTLGEPTGEVGAYLDWIKSDAGQKIVEASGFVPLPADQRKASAK